MLNARNVESITINVIINNSISWISVSQKMRNEFLDDYIEQLNYIIVSFNTHICIDNIL